MPEERDDAPTPDGRVTPPESAEAREATEERRDLATPRPEGEQAGRERERPIFPADVDHQPMPDDRVGG